MSRVTLCLLVLPVLFGGAVGAMGDAIRLGDGRPLVGVYYFTHWWEPWRSSDDRILEDFTRLKKMGVNAVFLDSEWSQMVDRDWYWLDRGHKLAKKAGMQILPWLSLKVWVDVSDPGRAAGIKNMYGVDLDIGIGRDGERGRTKPYDPAVIEAATRYGTDYIERYLKDGAILHVVRNGKSCPVVALTCELEWTGSFDAVTQQMFRLWLRAKYCQDINKLNKVWRTKLAGFDEIDLRDQELFDLGAHCVGKAAHPGAVEDHIEFRAQVMDTALSEIKARLKKKFPDLLIATEMPYQMQCKHPHAVGYRINTGCNPSAARHADIVVIRATAPLTGEEEKAVLNFKKQTGAQVVLTYRSSPSWGKDMISGARSQAEMNRLHAEQAARIADGFGVYSWNEMVDVHMMPDPEPPGNPDAVVTETESARTVDMLAGMVAAFTKAVESGSEGGGD